jgi:hypothetical protein
LIRISRLRSVSGMRLRPSVNYRLALPNARKIAEFQWFSIDTFLFSEDSQVNDNARFN